MLALGADRRRVGAGASGGKLVNVIYFRAHHTRVIRRRDSGFGQQLLTRWAERCWSTREA